MIVSVSLRELSGIRVERQRSMRENVGDTFRVEFGERQRDGEPDATGYAPTNVYLSHAELVGLAVLLWAAAPQYVEQGITQARKAGGA